MHDYICIKLYIYIKRWNCDIHILYTNRISYFCKKNQFQKRKKKDKKLFVNRLRAVGEERHAGEAGKGGVLSLRSWFFRVNGIACPFVATIARLYNCFKGGRLVRASFSTSLLPKIDIREENMIRTKFILFRKIILLIFSVIFLYGDLWFCFVDDHETLVTIAKKTVSEVFLFFLYAILSSNLTCYVSMYIYYIGTVDPVLLMNKDIICKYCFRIACVLSLEISCEHRDEATMLPRVHCTYKDVVKLCVNKGENDFTHNTRRSASQ